MLLVSSAQLPALSQISWFSAQKPRLAQKQQHKQQQQQQQTKQQTIVKPFQNLSGLGFEASKGDRGETKGRKLEKFERAQNGWDVGIQW